MLFHSVFFADEKLRPYKCAFCDRAFGKKSNCQKHEKLHAGHKFTSGRQSMQHPQVSKGNLQASQVFVQTQQSSAKTGPSSPAGIAALIGALGELGD
jgi:hypothetical protein